MKKCLLFLFFFMLLCLVLLTVTTHASASDSLHIPNEELEGFELNDGDTLIKIYSSIDTPMPLWIYRGYSIEQILSIEDLTPWILISNDEEIWDAAFIPDYGFYKEALDAFTKRFLRLLIYYAYHPEELFASSPLEVSQPFWKRIAFSTCLRSIATTTVLSSTLSPT